MRSFMQDKKISKWIETVKVKLTKPHFYLLDTLLLVLKGL